MHQNQNVQVEFPEVVRCEEDVAGVEGVGIAQKIQGEVDSLQDAVVAEEALEAILPFQGLEALTVGGGHRV